MTDPARTICFYCADQNPDRDKSRGITSYTYGLLSNLQKNSRVSLSAVVSKSSFPVPEGIPRFTIPFATDHIAGRLMSDHFHPLIVPRGAGDIWHYPKGFLPFGSQVRDPKVGTIADTILQFYADKYPRYRSQAAYRYWISMLKNSIEHLDLILTVSEFSKRQILEFSARYELNCPPIFVTYLGVDSVIVNDQLHKKDDEKYVLHIASKLPHKKTEWLLREWQIFEREKLSLPQLRLIGQLDYSSAAIASNLRNVQVHAPMSRRDLANAMKNARALVLPSEVEGFGLPALEAYRVGTPVVYVRDTAVEEVLGVNTPGGFFLKDGSIRGALMEVLTMDAAAIRTKDAELRDKFSWERCVEGTIAAYHSIEVSA